VYDCQNVGWYRTISISDVSGCKDPRGNTELINEEAKNGTVIFSGNLTISVVSPVYDQVYGGGKSSYMAKSWEYPFRLNFLSTSNAVVLFQSGGQFLDASVGSLYIRDGHMYMIVNTIYYAEGYGDFDLHSTFFFLLFISPFDPLPVRREERKRGRLNVILTYVTGLVISAINGGTDNVQLELISDITDIAGSNPYAQSFTFRSLVTADVYDGIYNFTFSAVDCVQSGEKTDQCKRSPDFLYSFKVILRVERDTDLYASLKFDVDIYDDDRFNVRHVDVSRSTRRENVPSLIRNLTAVLLRKHSLLQEYTQ
jgi:hypothetical protein